MIVIGASGHAKVVIEIAEAMGKTIEMVYDKDVTKVKLFQYPIMHTSKFDMDAPFIIAIGNNATRRHYAGLLKLKASEVLIHPTAIVSPKAVIGNGSVIMAGAIVNADAQIGKHVIINSGAVVEHDCVIGDFSHISPNASLAGGVLIGEETQIGIGATVIQGVTIGNKVLVGAGAVVIRSIEDHDKVAGVPAKTIK